MKKVSALLLVFILIFSMTASAAAVGFTPSVERKSGPTLVADTNEDGEEYGAIIFDRTGKLVGYIPSSDVRITAFSEKDNADDDIKKALNDADMDITNAKTVADLSDAVKEYLKEKYPDIDVNDIEVSNLFNIDITKDAYDRVTEGGYIRVKLKVDEEFLDILQRYAGVWDKIKSYSYKDGILTLDIYAGTTVAVIKAHKTAEVATEASGKTVQTAEGTSAQTGDMTMVWIICGSVFALAAVAVAVLLKKKA